MITDFNTADALRLELQNVIDGAGETENTVAVTINLQKYTAAFIPKAREAEFLAATDEDKIRFFSVFKKAMQSTTGEADFNTLFENEYTNEFLS